jgi:response regulator RpfG family c-di-GMP phosphodiesterase
VAIVHKPQLILLYTASVYGVEGKELISQVDGTITEKEISNMNTKKGTVLIVDDEPISVESLCHFLVPDYEILLADNGKMALELAETRRPDVILLDIVMPKMDGYEVFRRILDNPQLCDTPVLFITVMKEEECETRGLELGAHDYLTKPYNPAIVRLRVKNQIEFKRRSDLVRAQRDLLAFKNEALETALSRIRRLEGIITICMHCKQIRTDSDSWELLEKYVTDHSEAKFSHGICPTCCEAVYGTIKNELQENDCTI